MTKEFKLTKAFKLTKVIKVTEVSKVERLCPACFSVLDSWLTILTKATKQHIPALLTLVTLITSVTLVTLACTSPTQSSPERVQVVVDSDITEDMVWSSPGFDRNLWSTQAIHHSIQYIEANPVRKGLCENPEEYKWSSAFARISKIGLIPDIEDIPMLMKSIV